MSLINQQEAHHSLRTLLALNSAGVLCATGHRPQDLPGYRDEDFPVLVWIARRWLTRLSPEVVITGGALGWDQAVCEAAHQLGLVSIISVPFEGQHRRWRDHDQARYLKQLQEANLAYACFQSNLDNRSEVVKALLGRNVEMLRYSAQVLALHSGKETGGTYQCLQEARKRGIPVAGNAFADWEAYQRGDLPVIHKLSGTRLSNFQSEPLKVSGVLYPTLEHAFQASKTLDPQEREQVRAAPTSAQARSIGRQVTLRPDWNDLRLTVMEGLLRAKYRQPAYRDALLATGDALLIEGHTWNDTFFGVCKGVGENHLGRLLMQFRDELQSAPTSTARLQTQAYEMT